MLGRFLIQRRFVSILSSLVEKCNSCGIALQLVDTKKPGYIPQVSHKPYTKREDTIYEKYIKNLSEEDRQLLSAPAPKTTKEKEVHEHNGDYKECLRCRQIKYQSKVDQEQENLVSNSTILEQVESISDGRVVYVTNAVDFPIGLNRAILKAKNPIVVITKADLIFTQFKTAVKFPFFKQYVKQKYGIPENNVFLVSNTKDWGLRELDNYLESLPNKYYFVGDINSGKSSLISRLMFINKGDARLKFDKWNLKNGPGISYLPGFTRGTNSFYVGASELIDYPGLNSFELPNFKDFKNVFKNTKVFKKGAYDSKYESLKEGQILTVGGLFYVKMPNNGIIAQFKNLINFPNLTLKGPEKIVELSANLDASLEKFFLVKPTLELDTLIIPPFIGKIDLVVKNLGYIELTPTGAKRSNELIEILVPKHLDIEFAIRRPIISYVQKTLSGRDKKGNALNKRNKWKSTKVINSYNGGTISSKLIPKQYNNQFQCVSLLTGVDYDENTIVTSENYSQYWLE